MTAFIERQPCEACRGGKEGNVESSLFEGIIQTGSDAREASDGFITYVYVPREYREYFQKTTYYEYVKGVFGRYFSKYAARLPVVFFEKEGEVRGKFKKGAIYVFSPHTLSYGEFLWVLIHEIGHVVDVMFFHQENMWNFDESYIFYEYSWKDWNIIKEWQTEDDFVSWYAMTNMYEDFAESFTYFIFHNEDFLKKAEKSYILKKKYDFFVNYVFVNKEFIGTSFFSWDETKRGSYVWDVTKIPIDDVRFLEYIGKEWK